jgi:D-alanine-D-alanine ligase
MSSVIVACGGGSLERSVSLNSGSRAGRALRRLGHDVTLLDVDDTFVPKIQEAAPDFVFIALHGAGGEGGIVQDILGILGVPYTASDAVSSALCLDKHLFKALCKLNGIPTPTWHAFTQQAFTDYGAGVALEPIASQFPRGLVVKPASEGSSLGVSIVHDSDHLRGAIMAALSYDNRILLEEYIPGRELAVTVLGPPDAPRVLPVVELVYEDPLYSFAAHYEIGSAELREAGLDPETDAAVRDVAARAYSAAGCRDFARVDIRLDERGPWVLEINTVPGLTETGPTPLAAEFAGMSFEDLIARICDRVEGRVG